MTEPEDRRAVALQEAQKTYGIQYAMTIALHETLPIVKEDVENEILRIAERYDKFLSSGETGTEEKNPEGRLE